MVFAQSFQDDFADGDFSANPQWFGDIAKYTVSGAGNELQLNDLGNSGSAQLYVPISIQDSTTWEFLIRTALTTSGPSSSNRIRIYLQSDNANFAAATLNGYYLQIGETGSLDAIEIFRVTNGTATSILRGTDGLVSGASNNARVRVVRGNAGNWELFVDYAGGTTYVSEGTATDATHNSGGFFGVYTTYSTTQGDKFFYDDFLVSPLFVDVTAPNLISATAINATQVDVLFDEALDAVSANTAGNYTINNGITVSNAQLDGVNPALVHLTVSPLANQTTYQLNVTAVEDLVGNAITNANTNFTYTLIIPAGFQDLIFNEVMIDPNPVVNLPDAEYIELYNRTTGAIDLTGYKLVHRSASSGAETVRTLGAYLLQPNNYVILHNSPDYIPATNDLQIPSFPALNNTSAYLILRDAAGLNVDSILYDLSWYQDANKDDGGWSLELMNPNLVCKGGNNWIASNSPDGGTPGTINSVYDNTVDTIAPIIIQARQSDVNKAVISFDDIIDPIAAVNIGNYAVSGGVTVVFAQMLNQYSIELTFNINMTANTVYTVTTNNIGDCVGNVAARQANFTYYELSDAGHYDIIINEIFPDANPVVGLPEHEFVELYNRSNKNVNLEGYSFTDGTTTQVAVFPFYILKPNEYLIIYKKGGASYASFGPYLDFNLFPDLNATGDNLVLSDANNRVIDAVSYDDSWFNSSTKAEGGWTLERINPKRPCEGRENWTASVAQPPAYPVVGGTPGSANSVLQTNVDLQSPDALRAFPFGAANPFNSDTIRVYFSEAMGDTSGVLPSSYDLDNGINIIEAYLEGPFYNTIVVITDLPLQAGTVYTLSMNSGLTDCVGNAIALNNTVRFALPESVNKGELILNEILYNPVVSGVDYIELYNNSNKIFNIGDLWVSNTTGVFLNDANDVKAEYLLFPGEYVVLSSKPTNVEASYRTSGLANTPDLNKMIEFDLPSFADKEGTVVIYTRHGLSSVFVDSFTYHEDMQSPLIDDLNGVSLERIDFNVATTDLSNWHSAAQPVKFGTPTYINSSARNNEITDDGIIQLPNNTFSPDGDGYEDFLLINYNIDEIGYLGDIAVYDAHGRFIKQLVNNELLMPEGTIYWDGSTENGEKAIIGPYIIVAKLFHPSGKTKQYKKTCVLAGQF